ncbi:MAG: Chondroitin synthase [Mucilaginibacter sp.]|nr:Chondroitin synthase [Mucilaginibacter sp.]
MPAVITIVVPAYNQAEYLAETLDSVLAQIHTDWECIIVNDGSSDDTELIAKQYIAKDPRFKYVFQQNSGLSAARNMGISQASGKYILPLDADDLIDPAYVESGLKAFSLNPNLALVYAKARKFGAENKDWELPPYNFLNLLLSNCIFCSAIFKKSAWEVHGGYDTALKNGWEDWAFWVKILSADDEVFQIPQVLFFYRTRGKSMIRSMSTADQERVKWHIYEKNKETYQSLYPSPISIILENAYLKDHIRHILSSRPYSLGKLLLKPFAALKNIFKKQS